MATRSADVEHLRPAPHSLQAEQSVLGGLLLSNAALDVVDDLVVGADFYGHAHRVIYAAIRELIVHGRPADVVTVSEALRASDELDNAGGLEYLGQILDATPTAANVAHYATIVRERSTRRRLAELGAELTDLAHARDGRATQEVLDEVTRKVLALTERSAGSDPVLLTSLLPGVLEDIERRSDKPEVPGLRTGIGDLDARLLGLHAGELVILAGETSSGKTTLGMQFAFTAARANQPVAVFSLEMKPSALAERGIASVGMVNRHKMRTGRLDNEDWGRVSDAIAKLNAAAPILIDRPGTITVERIRARARRIKRKHGLGLVVIDYIQLIAGDGETRNEEVSAISRALKLMAMELDVPVVALSQLNRANASRQNKRPVKSDLRDSGSLEQDADVILFVYRDELHSGDEDVKGKAEIIIAKQREGELGTVYVGFLGQHNRFVDTEWRPRRNDGRREPEHNL